MVVEDQSEVEAFPRGELAPTTVVATHVSKIILGGETVFELKRAVNFPYVEFSTPARRLAARESEFALNRRAAPSLYRAVRRRRRHGGGARHQRPIAAGDGPGGRRRGRSVGRAVPQELDRRAETRLPSDATAEVVEARARHDLGAMTWPTIDASRDVERVVADARRRVDPR